MGAVRTSGAPWLPRCGPSRKNAREQPVAVLSKDVGLAGNKKMWKIK